MRGISTDARHEPLLNPSWMDLPASKAPGWGINGPGVSVEITKAAQAPRQVDSFVIIDDLAYVLQGRQKPDFAAAKYLREFAKTRPQLSPLIEQPVSATTPASWNPPKIAGRGFVMRW